MQNKRQDFTFIELLIVIVVIFILSGMFMLAGRQAQAAAKATKIVSGLAGVKTAVLTWYRENMDKIKNDGTINGTKPDDYFKTTSFSDYLNAKDFAIGTSEGNYQVVSGKTSDGNPVWYVCYHLENKPDKKDIKARLADKALAQPGHLLQNDSGSKWDEYSNGDDIYMEILVFNY